MMLDTKIQDLFDNDIRREINGVIKVDQDDEKNVYTELDEYVVTKESLKHIDQFFQRYLRSTTVPTDKTGVWISGDFGSGKSHFLKILSYLLENRTVSGKTALEFFEQKIQDPEIFSTIENSVTFGTKDVILFNIDSKSGESSERIVDILMRVFNEKRGYFGDVFWIAELEENLEDKGLLNGFKEAFLKINGNTWENVRDQYAFEQDDIIQALSDCQFQSKEASERLFEADGQNYLLSVEKFAHKVEKYCQLKGENHQIIFLIDEIGQYIGDNSQLMLNLQTVVEELGTILKGRAWIAVTSQADIDAALKGIIEKGKQQDFSKIQARFDTRLSLSSANVDEVIKKRILKKKKEHVEMLAAYYGEKKIILKNLISFSQGSAEMKKYRDEDDFVAVYPFVPYQFNILQKVFERIRSTGFTGKHLAKGERSMLNAYKEAAEKYGESEVGTLVPFYSFYDTIESFLDPIIIKTVRQADDNCRLEAFDCQIIKTLFMIRHVREIQPTLDNIVVLSLTSVDEDKLALKRKVAESLNRLERETLINQSGDTFHFLTNEEQEINREIKNIDIDNHRIVQEVFEEVFNSNNICKSSYGNYKFNKSVDDKLTLSSGADLTIRFLTPLSNECLRGSGQRTMDGANLSDVDSANTLLFIFPDNCRFPSQIENYLQINRYLTQNSSSRNDPEMQTILLAKQQEVQKLKESSVRDICQGVKDARIFIDGVEVKTIDVRNPKEMVKEGYDKLVENVYSKLSYITREFESETDVIRLMKSDDLEKYGVGKSEVNRLALEEVLNYILVKNERKVSIVLSDLMDHFMKKPYGWKRTTIAGLVATHILDEAIKLRYQKVYLSLNPEEITKYLARKEYADKVLIEVRKKTDQIVMSTVKTVLRDVFGKLNIPDKENELFEYSRDIFNSQKQALSVLSGKYSEEHRYPGKKQIDRYSGLLDDIVSISDSSAFLQKVADENEELIRLHGEAEPVLLFFEGPQSGIFKRVLGKVDGYSRNIQFLSEEAKRDVRDIEDILSSDAPYSQIKRLPQLEAKVEASLAESLASLKEEYEQKLWATKDDITKDLNSYSNTFSDLDKKRVLDIFDPSEKRVHHSSECAEIKLQIVNLTDIITKAYDIMEEIKKEKTPPSPIGTDEVPESTPSIIKGSSFFETAKDIETEEDLNAYLEGIRQKMIKILTGRKIRVR